MFLDLGALSLELLWVGSAGRLQLGSASSVISAAGVRLSGNPNDATAGISAMAEVLIRETAGVHGDPSWSQVFKISLSAGQRVW